MSLPGKTPRMVPSSMNAIVTSLAFEIIPITGAFFSLLFAVQEAEDGYEDERGFHFGQPAFLR
jgi:hypothetical protein